jgi:hypothetical protein
MSETVSRFTISQGLDNTFLFTIKANGSTVPMQIVAGDAFTAHLIKLSDNNKVITKALTVVDALNGKVSLTLLQTEVDSLSRSVGPSVDRYYPKPEYKLLLECDTTNNGNFIAKVPEVYVD